MMRGGLITLIFQKTLILQRGAITDKAPITLMSTDIDAIVMSFQDIHDMWGNIIEMGVGLFILQRFVGNVGFIVVIPLVRKCVPALPSYQVSPVNSLHSRYSFYE